MATADSPMRTELPEQTHVALPGEKQTGSIDPNAELQVTLLLRRRRELPELHGKDGDKPGLPRERKHLTSAELAAAHGATREDIAVVERFSAEVAPHESFADYVRTKHE